MERTLSPVPSWWLRHRELVQLLALVIVAACIQYAVSQNILYALPIFILAIIMDIQNLQRRRALRKSLRGVADQMKRDIRWLTKRYGLPKA